MPAAAQLCEQALLFDREPETERPTGECPDFMSSVSGLLWRPIPGRWVCRSSVRSERIIVPVPILQLVPDVILRTKPVRSHALVLKPTIESFHAGAVSRLTRSAEVERHATLIVPATLHLRDELRAVQRSSAAVSVRFARQGSKAHLLSFDRERF